MTHSSSAVYPPLSAEAGVGQEEAASAAAPCASPIARLPTLQRNALRKLFDRLEFTPEEVAKLGFRRLQQAEGIGQKGLRTIQHWLHEYGFEMQPDPQPARPGGKQVSRHARNNIEIAMRVLRAHGYVVQRPEDGLGPDG